jgi:Uncharacterized protein conserved in bacteria (DUF2252)
MTTSDAPWPSRRDLTARGKELRNSCPRGALASWASPADRPDPLALLEESNQSFLGWTVGPAGRHLYVRQLRDAKIKPRVERYSASIMRRYAKLCGWGLARGTSTPKLRRPTSERAAVAGRGGHMEDWAVPPQSRCVAAIQGGTQERVANPGWR